MNIVAQIGVASWQVLTQMAPYLLLGFLICGILAVFISPQWVERHLGGRGWGPIWKSALFGVPLPLCSCGVIPVAASMRRHGASRGATAAFLLSTPQTGVDSILATYALLGPVFAVFRPLAALLSGLVGGGLVAACREDAADDAVALPTGSDGPTCGDDGCLAAPAGHGRLRHALVYGFVTLPRDLARPLLVGLLLAGVVTAVAEEGFLAAYLGGGIVAMLAMMVVGIPLYVCATASIPVAVSFIHLGASPGAALVFLIAGPATNTATISVIWNLLGRRTALLYLGTVAAGALASGFALDMLYEHFAFAGPLAGTHSHAGGGGDWFGTISAVALLAVLAVSLLVRQRNGADTAAAPAARARGRVIRIRGMSCQQCAATVKRTLLELPGVEDVAVDLKAGQATVYGDLPATETLIAAVTSLGYRAVPAEA